MPIGKEKKLNVMKWSERIVTRNERIVYFLSLLNKLEKRFVIVFSTKTGTLIKMYVPSALDAHVSPTHASNIFFFSEFWIFIFFYFRQRKASFGVFFLLIFMDIFFLQFLILFSFFFNFFYRLNRHCFIMMILNFFFSCHDWI